jgi:small subunit ribosomal protein S17
MLPAIRILSSKTTTTAIPSSFRAFSTTSSTTTINAIDSSTPIKCLSCGELGHIAKNCPNSNANNMKSKAQDYFKQGRCLLCGEIGHQAKYCPSIGKNPDDGKSIEPKHEKVSLSIRNSKKVCLQCGETGHVMRDCPVLPSTVKIKGIHNRYSGSRLQKQLPLMLKEEKTLPPILESFANVPPKVGVVVSTSAQKTIGVLVERTIKHPLLKISLDRSRKFLVHDESETAVCGDVVLIQQTRPISKNKHHALKKVLLSLNERKETMAERVSEANKVYSQINEEAVTRLAELREKNAEKSAGLKKKNTQQFQELKEKFATELTERIKNLPSVIEEVKAQQDARNEEWLKQMKRKLDSENEWIRKVEANPVAHKKEDK